MPKSVTKVKRKVKLFIKRKKGPDASPILIS
jgi:hypothetical protein